jgi:hypothetical protein
LQGVVQHSLDGLAEVLRDVDGNEALAHHLLLGVARDLDRLVVPLVDEPVVVDAWFGIWG